MSNRKNLNRRNLLPGSRKVWFGLIGGLLILLFVFTKFVFTVPVPNPSSDILLLGHAGSGFLSPLNPFNPYPANSMASIVKAMEEHGADGVELDVQLSKDGVPILYHDVTLESMTDETGFIDDHKAADVVGLKYNAGFFYNLFQDERIVTLEQVLQRFATYPELPYLHIDLRNQKPERHLYYAQTLLKLLAMYNYPLNKLAFISPNADFLLAFRQVNPDVILIPDTAGDFERTFKVALEHDFHGICADGKSVSPEQVQRSKENGLLVVLFGGKSHSRLAKMIAQEPYAVQVNNVEAMRKMLE